jgi:hypothetical protein
LKIGEAVEVRKLACHEVRGGIIARLMRLELPGLAGWVWCRPLDPLSRRRRRLLHVGLQQRGDGAGGAGRCGRPWGSSRRSLKPWRCQAGAQERRIPKREQSCPCIALFAAVTLCILTCCTSRSEYLFCLLPINFGRSIWAAALLPALIGKPDNIFSTGFSFLPK